MRVPWPIAYLHVTIPYSYASTTSMTALQSATISQLEQVSTTPASIVLEIGPILKKASGEIPSCGFVKAGDSKHRIAN